MVDDTVHVSSHEHEHTGLPCAYGIRKQITLQFRFFVHYACLD